MRLKITMDLDNAAFTENLAKEDTAEMEAIRYALDDTFSHLRVLSLGDTGVIRDYNGNTVGEWVVLS